MSDERVMDPAGLRGAGLRGPGQGFGDVLHQLSSNGERRADGVQHLTHLQLPPGRYSPFNIHPANHSASFSIMRQQFTEPFNVTFCDTA